MGSTFPPHFPPFHTLRKTPMGVACVHRGMAIFDLILPMMRTSVTIHTRRGRENAEQLADEIGWDYED